MNRKMRVKEWHKGILAFFLCMISVVAFAQGRQVTGVITDATTGEPMIGVNVLVKGTTNGTITDFDGNYAISDVPANATLVISYIGYLTQELPAGNNSVINVLLKEDTQSLEEVVIVGYGVQKKSDLTGAISSVSSERISSIGTSSVMSALQGSTPGVDISTNSARPGSSFSIQIRGQNSLNAGNPLYVVDGIVKDDIDFLNPADIEKIDILKDASSTAIYGSRGSNGVVIVQTKNASSTTSKLNISYDGYYGVRKIARVPDFMDGRENIDYRTSRYYSWDGSKYILKDADKRAILQNSTNINSYLYNENYVDWLDLGTQDGSQQNHYITLAGSSSDINYSLGLGFQNEEGNFINEEMKRYVLRGSINHKASKYFSTGANFTLSHTITNDGSENGYRDLLRMQPFFSAYDEEGELIRQPGIAANIKGSGNFTSSGNPLLEIENSSDETRRFDVLASFFAELKPMDGLILKTTFSPDLNYRREGWYRPKTADRSQDIGQTEPRERFSWTWDNVATYMKTFNELHNLNVTLIHSVYKTQTELLRVNSNNYPYVSLWYNVFNGTMVMGNSSSEYSQSTMISYAARANYDYAGKYMVTGTVRYDGSSKLADKWAAFPSAAVAWRLSEEDFMKDINWLDNLKARVSFGYSGNNNGVNAYGTQMTPNTSTNIYYDFDGSVLSGFGTGTPVNPNLTWEKTREWNAGIDFGIFGGRINGSIDFYDKLSDHLLMKRMLAIESGVESMTDNIGSVNNRGVEVALNTVNVRSKDWEWRTSFTFAHNKNAIRSLYGKKDDVVGESRFIGKPINVIFDYKVNGVYSQAEWESMSADQRKNMAATQPGYAKVVNTNWLSYRDGEEGNDKIDTYDRTILGQVDPKWTGSLTSYLRFRDFDFSFNIFTRQGMLVSDYFSAEFVGAATSDRGRKKVNFDYYVPAGVPRYDWSNFTIDEDGQPWANMGTSTENANAKYPVHGMTGQYYGNNGRYQKTSFVKVRNITVGYSLPRTLISKAHLTQARIYFNVLNPFTFTDYIGWDPEFATTTLANGNGPSSVTYQVGVNLKF
ncbi:TonB-linked SusC/RagA family outer membrane protein [Parabacteroides sp. PF5-5]|uniref:SusC/RagA family TonB-linked outer membrane protein n=1 Tax=unclassified Parabacteroides TaxID=2649774 RepID=UPI002476437D|nr:MULTISPECIES: TonB-dependent receptor [unclassified Parabacteroides]MDH6303601.1 TonB-linked SusC/RagA family outer membrane protein [Parabacteroides sp. PH5-39]MDH6314923.1 TonB-linked SusC/RagA family outer membrane protein [Parabacteroides sp. PF5-13]MDH6318260.1 TonB-linked SusC/RagA family outer membrane protein [Parabacteroides sp. PH5-13]MDH6321807.1 TonB-linked SusC/RagA family outer membrane protein [Parabacteroides sp. PH5-8]MDH6325931.1 TonB-linked SusC/RagA family outer membrane